MGDRLHLLRIVLTAGIVVLATVDRCRAQSVCQDARLTASDPGVFESFGYSVAVSGETALIGAEWDRELGTEAGAAYIFRLVPSGEPRSGWVEAQKLLASDGARWNHFGHSVAMDGDLALIGAGGHLHDDKSGTGSGYMFRYNGSTWVEEEELLASDGAWQDGFGTSVSLSGDLAVIGAVFDDDNGAQSGSAYVFRYDAKSKSWLEEQKLLASDGAGGDFFGGSVAVSGDTVIVGAHGDDNEIGAGAGAAYVFCFDGSRWTQEQKLLAFDTEVVARFGVSVSISGDAVVIGALLTDNPPAAYAFRFDPESSAWIDEQKLLASDGDGTDQFGRAVALDGDTAVIGAWVSDAGGPDSGAAYVFRFDPDGSGSWFEQQQLLPEPNAWTNFFGRSVAIEGNTVVIGAHGEDQQRGAAYVFDVALNCSCPHDLDADGSVGVSDLLSLLGSWGPCPKKGDCPADFDNTGDVGVKDLLILLGNWGPCP